MRLFLYPKFKEFIMTNATLRYTLQKIRNICSLGIQTRTEYGLFSQLDGILFYPSFQYLIPTAGQVQLAQSFYLHREEMVDLYPTYDIDMFDFFFFASVKSEFEKYNPLLTIFPIQNTGFSELKHASIKDLVYMVDAGATKAVEEFILYGEDQCNRMKV